MTDQVDDVEQARLDRIARLTTRRSTPGPASPTRSPSARRRRRHPAQRSRIVAAGIGATTMFGIVTMLGVAQAAESQPSQSSTAVAPSAIVPTAPGTAPVGSTTTDVLATAPAPAADVATPPAVIELTARPVVLVVAPAPAQSASAGAAPQPAPVATTSASS